MLSGGELIIVAMAVVALAVLTFSALAGVVVRLLRGDVTVRRRRIPGRRTRPKG